MTNWLWLASIAIGVLYFAWRRRARTRAAAAWERLGSPPSPACDAPLRIVVLSIGTRGDVEPLAALAAAALRRGHSVTFCTTENFKSLVESVPGLEFRSCGLARVPQPPSLYSANSMVAFLTAVAGTISQLYLLLGAALYRATLGAAGEDETGASGGVDVILCNLFAQHFGLDIAEKLGVPIWLLKLAPDSGGSAFEPPFGQPRWSTSGPCCWRSPRSLGGNCKGSSRFSRVLTSAQHLWGKLAQIRAAGSSGFTVQQNAFRRDVLALPPVGLATLSVMQHTPTLFGYSAAVAPPPPDQPPWHIVTGYWATPRATFREQAVVAQRAPGKRRSVRASPPANSSDSECTLDPALQAFLDGEGGDGDASRPVCVTFGSMVLSSGAEAAALVERCVSVVLERGHRCIFIAGWSDQASATQLRLAPFVVGGRLHLQREAPYAALFPRCAALICHGGAGTFAAAMHAALPVVVIPLLDWFDQPGWGERARALGAGGVVRRGANGEAPPSADIALALDAATSESAQRRVAEVADALASECGTDVALDALEGSLAARLLDCGRARRRKSGGDTRGGGKAVLTEAAAEMVARTCVAHRRREERKNSRKND